MKKAFDTSILREGDILLYFSKDVIDWVIALKTWTKVAHVEFYRGNGISYASRNGIGVNSYPLRTKGIAVVLRLNVPFDFKSADNWFNDRAKGQKYDWKGLLCFTLAVKQGCKDRMFCSELLTRLLRAGKTHPFNPQWDADRTPPSFFLVTNIARVVWSDQDLF